MAKPSAPFKLRKDPELSKATAMIDLTFFDPIGQPLLLGFVDLERTCRVGSPQGASG